ncbi:hypothetical protein PILCRDRAFT_638457 [Piloderma croceum F 1598]|uniref:Uncharacterized protein n=1 Tax=Piloderma croceum (strain F 1598) TaxID=765440 RepID=A0A0C3FA93_PILCF|nr:hypothetical protein PILCRDRAFT_638457 [Piloderma croceum F 1598]
MPLFSLDHVSFSLIQDNMTSYLSELNPVQWYFFLLSRLSVTSSPGPIEWTKLCHFVHL